MALALNNLKRVDMPLNKETIKPWHKENANVLLLNLSKPYLEAHTDKPLWLFQRKRQRYWAWKSGRSKTLVVVVREHGNGMCFLQKACCAFLHLWLVQSSHWSLHLSNTEKMQFPAMGEEGLTDAILKMMLLRKSHVERIVNYQPGNGLVVWFKFRCNWDITGWKPSSDLRSMLVTSN